MSTATPHGIDEAAWLRAVSAEVTRLRTARPDLSDRLDSAFQLATSGAVQQNRAGLYTVESRTTPGVVWEVSGSCDCPDAEHEAPDGLCAHRLAVGLIKRATHRCQAPAAAPTTIPPEGMRPEGMRLEGDAAPHTAPPRDPAPCPEAAFSLCLRGRLDGQDAQLTVRGATAAAFQANLAAVRGLLDAPAGPAPASPAAPVAAPTAEGWCLIHNLQMERQSNERGSWYSHRATDGSWCRGKKKGA